MEVTLRPRLLLPTFIHLAQSKFLRSCIQMVTDALVVLQKDIQKDIAANGLGFFGLRHIIN